MGKMSNWKHDDPPQETILFIDSIDHYTVSVMYLLLLTNIDRDQLREVTASACRVHHLE